MVAVRPATTTSWLPEAIEVPPRTTAVSLAGSRTKSLASSSLLQAPVQSAAVGLT